VAAPRAAPGGSVHLDQRLQSMATGEHLARRRSAARQPDREQAERRLPPLIQYFHAPAKGPRARGGVSAGRGFSSISCRLIATTSRASAGVAFEALVVSARDRLPDQLFSKPGEGAILYS